MVTNGKPGGPRPAECAIDVHVSVPDPPVLFGLKQRHVPELEKWLTISPPLLYELGALVAEWRARIFERDKNFNRSPFESWRQICEAYCRVIEARISIQGIIYNDGAAIYIDPVRNSLENWLTAVWDIEQTLKPIAEGKPAKGNPGRKLDAKPEFTRQVQAILQKHGLSLVRYNNYGKVQNYRAEFLSLLMKYADFGIKIEFLYIIRNKRAARKSKTIRRTHKIFKISDRTAVGLIKAACLINR